MKIAGEGFEPLGDAGSGTGNLVAQIGGELQETVVEDGVQAVPPGAGFDGIGGGAEGGVGEDDDLGIASDHVFEPDLWKGASGVGEDVFAASEGDEVVDEVVGPDGPGPAGGGGVELVENARSGSVRDGGDDGVDASFDLVGEAIGGVGFADGYSGEPDGIGDSANIETVENDDRDAEILQGVDQVFGSDSGADGEENFGDAGRQRDYARVGKGEELDGAAGAVGEV